MTVLFSPLDHAYGTLYGAILLTRPERVVVVTSVAGLTGLHEALDAARFFHTTFEFETHVLSNAQNGWDEARALAKFLTASAGERNIVNLSGGTPVLETCLKTVAAVLREHQKRVREVTVIDRRDELEQKREPLFVGELVEASAVAHDQ